MPEKPADQALAEIEAAMRDMERLAKPSGSTTSARTSESKPNRTKTTQRAPSTAPKPGRTPGRDKPATGSQKPDTRSLRRSTRPKGPLHQRIITFLVGLVFAVVLPFYILLRLSVYLYQAFNLWPWLAIAGGVFATVLLLMIYVAWIRWRVGSGFKFSRGVTRGLIVLVGMYVGYTAMYVSASNVKTAEVRETYTSLQPLLRLATSTFILMDSDLVITDGERKPEDYAAMGLPLNQRSLHYVQDQSGYVHAVDLRTKGRDEWKNLLMTVYFELAGFETLRHTGTADHLHVSLPVNQH